MKNQEERYFIKVGNCFVKFLGLWHEIKMCPEYHKAEVYWTIESAKADDGRI